MATSTIPEGVKVQREYIEQLEAGGFGYDLLIGDAFIRGMRDIGYKSTSFALAEVVDNAVQADATHVDIIFGFDGGAMPTKIAVADDGHGMEAKMTRLALIWGAGTRGRNTSGFGKYGYGLPSAAHRSMVNVPAEHLPPHRPRLLEDRARPTAGVEEHSPGQPGEIVRPGGPCRRIPLVGQVVASGHRGSRTGRRFCPPVSSRPT